MYVRLIGRERDTAKGYSGKFRVTFVSGLSLDGTYKTWPSYGATLEVPRSLSLGLLERSFSSTASHRSRGEGRLNAARNAVKQALYHCEKLREESQE